MKESKSKNYEGQTVYVGIDVHKKSYSIHPRLGDIHMKSVTMNPSASDVVTYLK